MVTTRQTPYGAILMRPASATMPDGHGSTTNSGYERSLEKISWQNNSVSWYSTYSMYYQLNDGEATYYYVALGWQPFDFVPVFVIMLNLWGVDNDTHARYGLTMSNLTTSYVARKGFTSNLTFYNDYGKKSSDGKTIYWYSESSASYQVNDSGSTYYWIAFGWYCSKYLPRASYKSRRKH